MDVSVYFDLVSAVGIADNNPKTQPKVQKTIKNNKKQQKNTK